MTARPVGTIDSSHEVAQQLFAGPGEMHARCMSFDWSSTPLGLVSQWTQSLRTTVGIVLNSRNPMFLWWGPELIQIYNDAYRPSLGEGGRHPLALGMCARDFWTDIWSAIEPQIRQVMSGGEATWHEDQLLPIERNGRLEDVWWTYSYSAVHDDDGSIGGTLVVCQETTRRMLVERERERLVEELALERARLAEVFRQAPSFLAVLRGPDHVFERVNDAYYQLVGHRELLGKPLLDALPEIRDQNLVSLMDGVLASGAPYVGHAVPVRLARTPGIPAEVRFADFVYQPLIEADGTCSGIVAHGSDVTEQVLARREIERLLADSERARAEAESARAEAESANRAKADFLAVMSHELRTPLNAIGGYAELMEMGIRGPISRQQAEDLRRIQSSQRHLLGLVNEVLNYARLETGTVHYDPVNVVIRAAVGAAEALVAPQARAKSLTLFVSGGPPDLSVFADADKVQQILVNLLSNAVKFTEPGGQIELSWEQVDSHALIRVRDTGIGIPKEKMQAVFDPFVQVRSDFTRPQEGAGLGLAISRDLARGMGGDLLVESVEAEGSTLTLQLPARA